MSHVKKVIQAIKIKMMLNRLSQAKENAMREFLGLPPRTSWYDDCSTAVMTCVKDKLCQIFCPCCLYDRDRLKKRLGCWDSPVFKHFIGFLGGVLLSMLVYFILVYQIDAHPSVAFTICSVTSLVLTLVMAFSDTARCLVLLMLPQFFSSKGRMLLLMYALFLAINHPLVNMSRNITVMSQSTTCGQEMALNGTKELVKAATAPIQSVMESVEEVVQKLKTFADGLRDMYTALGKSIKQIGGTIKEVVKWLVSMTDKCNEKIGTPYQKCRDVFHQGKEKCRDKMKILKFVCNIVDLVAHLCNIVRIGGLLCKVVEAIQKLMKTDVDMPTVSAIQSAREMFFFNTSIEYNFNYTFTQSKSYSNIRRDITREIQGRLDSFIGFINFIRNIMVLGTLLIVIKAVYYRYKWLSEDRYDNIYITFTVRDLDERRKEKNKPGILPLTFDESLRYITGLSATMINKERKKLVFGVIIFLLSFFNAAFYLFCDFGLYAVLKLIEKHFSIDSKVPVPPHTKLHVSGEGPMSDMYRSIVAMFDPLTSNNVRVDVLSCVPHPHEPDWDTYKLIGIIYFVCLLLTITEAYGLRLRHFIMACYFPKRERRRAIWLFNHILKLRGGTMAAARDSVRKRHAGEVDQDHISLKGRLAASFPICEKFLKWWGWEVKSCLYCGREGKPDDYFHFVHCAYYDCDAVYCLECFADLDNKCAVCMKAVDAKGIGSSEEIDSSLDEREKMLSEGQKQAKQAKISSIKAARRPSRRMAAIRAQLGIPGGPGLEGAEFGGAAQPGGASQAQKSAVKMLDIEKDEELSVKKDEDENSGTTSSSGDGSSDSSQDSGDSSARTGATQVPNHTGSKVRHGNEGTVRHVNEGSVRHVKEGTVRHVDNVTVRVTIASEEDFATSDSSPDSESEDSSKSADSDKSDSPNGDNDLRHQNRSQNANSTSKSSRLRKLGWRSQSSKYESDECIDGSDVSDVSKTVLLRLANANRNNAALNMPTLFKMMTDAHDINSITMDTSDPDKVVLDMQEIHGAISDNSDLSDCSSLYTDDLDFSYQDEKNVDLAEVSDDEHYVLHRPRKRLDLVYEDIFDDTESDSDLESELHVRTEPRNQLLFRL